MRTLSVLAAFVIISGCSSTIQVRREEPPNNDRVFNYEQLNAWMAGASGLTICLDDTIYRAEFARVADDSIFFIEIGTRLHQSIETARVVKVLRKDHGAGALTGALVGTLGGIAAAVVLTPIVASSHEGREEAGLLLMVGLPAVGFTFGTVIGLSNGSVQECRFERNNVNPAQDSLGGGERLQRSGDQAP